MMDPIATVPTAQQDSKPIERAMTATVEIDVRREVLEAEERIRLHIRETPLEPSIWLGQQGGCEVYLKLENLQPDMWASSETFHAAVVDPPSLQHLVGSNLWHVPLWPSLGWCRSQVTSAGDDRLPLQQLVPHGFVFVWCPCKTAMFQLILHAEQHWHCKLVDVVTHVHTNAYIGLCAAR